MSAFENFGNDLQLLSELLNPKRDNESSDDEEHVTSKNTNTYSTPADIREARPESVKSPYEKTKTEKICEDDDELHEKIDAILPKSSWKQLPVWDISYKQTVTASDVFLQLGNKTPSTASCENMIVTIRLPGECRQTINLNIKEKSLELDSSKFYLNLDLPQPVDPKLGNAEFDSGKENLVISLVMDREFDFVNF